MASDANGYLRLSRRIFDNELWQEERKFSRFEAWVDMIQSATYAPHTKIIGRLSIDLERGELLASIRFLSLRWGWTKKRVEGWLKALSRREMIRGQRETPAGTIYLLVNYEFYNVAGDSQGQPEGTARGQQGDSKGTARGQRKKRKGREEGKEEPPTGVQGVELPPELDNPEGREAVELWLSYKKERHEAYKPIGLRELVRELAGMGGVRALAAVRHSMAKNWAGVFEPTKNGAAGRHPPRAPGQSDENLKSAEDIQTMLGDW